MIRILPVYVPRKVVLLATTELVLVVGALLAATYAQFAVDAELAVGYEHGFLKVAIAALVCMLCMHYFDLYDSGVLKNPREGLGRIVQGLGSVCIVLAAVYYVYPVVQLGRNLLIVWVLSAGLLLIFWRKLYLSLIRSTFNERALLLGDGPLAHDLVLELRKRPENGLKVVGYVDVGPADEPADGVQRLGSTDDLVEIVHQRGIESIVLTMADRRGRLPLDTLLHLKTQGVRIVDGADVFEAVSGRVPLASLRLSWLLFSDGFCVSRAMLIYKRMASIVLAACGVLLATPLMLLTALAVRLDSPGPVIFRQKRVGQDGKAFTLYKFRSMYLNADRNGPARPAERGDERFTRVGRWIRRLRIDEIPQLWNILRGDMYFIGPRPFVPELEEEYAKQIPFYSHRWSIKPGATGWAQIQQGYCTTVEDNRQKLGYDLFYIKHMSLGLDCVIFFQTVKTLLLGRGAV